MELLDAIIFCFDEKEYLLKAIYKYIPFQIALSVWNFDHCKTITI